MCAERSSLLPSNIFVPGAFHVDITENKVVQTTIERTIVESRGIGQSTGGAIEMEGRSFGRLILALGLFMQGCLFDIAPAREPLDAT